MPEDFLAQFLEPVEGGVPVDTHYNLMIRRGRKIAWLKAATVTRYHRARMDFADAQRGYADLIELDYQKAGKLSDARGDLVHAYRAAVAQQVLTPAPTLTDVTWKRKAALDRGVPLTAEQIERVIAEDEAFLAAHPTRVHT